MKFGIIPDIAVFAKSLGNGVPTGAVIGTRAAMDGANISFISSTYWTESLGPAASVATLKKMEKINVPAHVELTGRSIMKSWESLAEKHQMPVETSGYPCLAHFRFNHKQSEKLRTIYTRLMLDRGFLAGLSVYPTIAHTPEIIQLYHEAIDEVFGEIADIIKEGSAGRFPDNMTAHSGFARLL
jgi:glutamate-1-semialdehyde 2,1-aminomutase